MIRAINMSAERRRSRRASVLAVGAGLSAAMLFAGCASGPAETKDEASGPVTLNFAWWGDASRADRYEQAIDLFEEENPDITIQTGYAGFGDYWTARNTEAASRTLPDVFQMDLAYLNEYGSYGHVRPLDEYFGEQITVDTIDEGLVAAGTVDDQTFGIASSSSTQATFVNEPLLAELGISVPEGPLTWDEYDAFLGEVAAAGAQRSPAVYGGLDYTQYFWLFQTWLGQQGASLIDDGALGFEKDDLAAWWGRSAGLQSGGAVLPPERQAQLEGVDALGAAEIATDISWDNFLPRFSEGPAAPELTMITPPIDDEDETGLFLKPGLMLSIASNSEHPTEAAAFIDFLVNSPEVGKIFGMSRGVPASSDARAGVEAGPLDEQILTYEESIADRLDGQAPPAVKGLGTLEQTFVAISQDVTYGTISVDEAVDKWFTEAEAALGR
ncbi:ABC transporter substrate-binding protein [Agromyces sp. LHK192]|uniref:ABC transporter substrate-binding protein n=1 Tax=Agromyces sp. LHK192 TaxID=2498704 RepID=UPI000FD9B454|nr:extracellular solute-binding protein [Agromyces sp. LHK192]